MNNNQNTSRDMSEERMTEQDVLQKLEQMNLIDDFLMTAAAGYGEEGREMVQSMLEIIMQRKLPNLVIQAQKIMPAVDVGKHGIRMDVFIKDTEVDENGNPIESVYDIEMEKHEFEPKRARFYHSLADRELLHSGDEYELLGNVFVIIIMPKDPFGKDRMMYTIKRKVVEDPTIEYDDGDTTFYLYTKGTVTDGKQEIVDLLRYVENSVEENANNPKLKKIHEIIQRVKHDREVGASYMKWFERDRMIRKEAMEEARIEVMKEADAKVKEAESRAKKAECKAEEVEAQLAILQEELSKLKNDMQ